MNVELLIKGALKTERSGAASHIAHRGARALLHDLAELTCDGELAVALHHGALRLEQVAPP